MLEMNRNEFEKALAEMRAEHDAALRAASMASAGRLSDLEEQLARERSEKAVSAASSPTSKQVAHLEDTIAALRLQIASGAPPAASETATPSSDVCAALP